jgi:glutamate 5-kinase
VNSIDLERVTRVVIKVGSAVLSGRGGGLDEVLIRALVKQIAVLRARDVDVIVVSSGAVSAGMAEMGLTRRPTDVSEKQALAAIGQGELMHLYHGAFAAHDLHVAQILLSRGDLDDRQRYLNARNALLHLLEMGVIPIINENDTTAIEELTFGDNDFLSAVIAAKTDAQLLLILTVVDGLHGEDGKVIPEITRVTEETLRLVRQEQTPLGRGGMETKLLAAKSAMANGVRVVIASGKSPDAIERIFAGEALGTTFIPSEKPLQGRKRWIAFGQSGEGAHVQIDAGAVRALVEQGRSLLPIGVIKVGGTFARGDVVDVLGPDGEVVGRGRVNLSSEQVSKVCGVKSGDLAAHLGDVSAPEVIHRDDLIVHR